VFGAFRMLFNDCLDAFSFVEFTTEVSVWFSVLVAEDPEFCLASSVGFLFGRPRFFGIFGGLSTSSPFLGLPGLRFTTPDSGDPYGVEDDMPGTDCGVICVILVVGIGTVC